MNNKNEPSTKISNLEPAELAARMHEFSDAAAAFSREHPRLLKEYPNQWISVYHGEVCAKSDNLESLLKELENRGIPCGDTLVRFMDPDPKIMFL